MVMLLEGKTRPKGPLPPLSTLHKFQDSITDTLGKPSQALHLCSAGEEDAIDGEVRTTKIIN